MERSTRRSFQGVVVKNANDKTIAVLVVTQKPHPKYKKLVKFSRKLYAHDETNLAQIGDTVTIMETRPLSATKRFRLVSIDKQGVASIELKGE
jgi:small subunit ribosomal protein S17